MKSGRGLWCKVLLSALLLVTCLATMVQAGEKIKIGFIIPDATDNWWLREWDGATKAAEDLGFTLVKTEATDADKILAALENYASQGVQGLVFATPDVKLGPAVVARCKALGMKLYTSSNQFEDATGRLMTEVHFSGLAAYQIGVERGEAMLAEAQRRGWKWEETALMMMSIRELATAVERIDGSNDALTKGGFPKEKLFDAPIRSWDAIGSFAAADIVLTQHPEVKNWFVTASNDPIVVGAVRALEGRGYKAENIIGVGINGGEEAKIEFEKASPTGFWGSMFLSGDSHGYHDAKAVYEWIKDGKEPPFDYRLSAILLTRDNFKEYMN